MKKDKAEEKEPEFPPVSFFVLFKFSTPFDIFLNVVGVIAAASAGAAQPILGIIFGALALNFISFGTTVNLYHSGQVSVDELHAAAQDFRQAANQNALYFVYAGIGVLLCTWVFMYTWTYTSEVNSKRIREAYLKAVLQQDIEYFDKVGAGEVATRIQSDTHLVQQGISDKLPLAVHFGGSFIAGMIIGFTECWQLALAMSSVLPCMSITGALMGKFMTRYTQLSTDGVATAGNIAEESISTIRTAKAFGIQSHLGKIFDDKITQAGNCNLKLAIVQGCGFAAFFFISYAAYGLAFSFGTTLINQGHADAGQIITVFMAVFIGSFSLSMVPPQVVAIATARGAAAKLFQTISLQPTIHSSDSTRSTPPLSLSKSTPPTITLENITFTYPSRQQRASESDTPKSSSSDSPKPISTSAKPTEDTSSPPPVAKPTLDNLSLTFHPNKSYALVGPSGSGKSTILSLLLRFYDPQSGRVLVDGKDVKDLDVVCLRRNVVRVVQQEPVLFGKSVKENVEFGLHVPSTTEEKKFQKIKNACIKANADEFIMGLPKGYDTLVGEGGMMLSGGQKQRVAIARAIVGDEDSDDEDDATEKGHKSDDDDDGVGGSVLVLDEATSALDTKSEEIVFDSLLRRPTRRGRTTIIIAHRLSTIRNVDKIFVMNGGKVVEAGSHDELMGISGGLYARLVEAQGLKKLVDTNGTGTTTATGSGMGGMGTPVDSRARTPTRRISLASIPDAKGKEKENATSSTTPSPSQKQKPGAYSIPYLFYRMGSIVSDKWLQFLTGSIFAILVGLIYPAFGVVYALSIEGFSQPDPHVRRVKGDQNALWFFILAIVAGFTMGAQNYFFASGAATLTTRLRKLCFRAVMRQDVEFFDNEKNTTGVLTAKINGDPGKVNGIAGITLATIIQSIATILAGLIAGVVIVWKIGLIGLACTPFLLSVGYTRLIVIMLKDEKNKEEHAQSAQVACESTAAIRTVAALTREEGCLAEYSASLEEPLRRAIRTGGVSTLVFGASQASMFFVIALVFWYGSILFSRLEITVFQLFVGLMTTTLGALQAGGMFQFSPDISAARGAASDIVTLLDRPSLIEPVTDESPVDDTNKKRIEGRIEARDLRFAYPTRPSQQVLRGVSFTVEPSQYVAFVGPSGSGKSTIVQLIQRFYDTSSGTILIDNNPLPSLDVFSYRQDVALVSQEPKLYSGTLRFNILLGATKKHEEVSQEELEEACRKANILDFVKELPDGFETQVGSKGSQLSGGQKQRIAIARALIRNPKILLLDEATSALDSTSEKVVQAALDEAAKGRTTIAIAHRLSTIQDADKIFFIKNGRISEEGTHNDLLGLRGDYFDYVQLQTLQQSE